MNSRHILLLGGSGMLARMMLDYFARFTGYKIDCYVRRPETVKELKEIYPWVTFYYNINVFNFLEGYTEKPDWVINNVGVIKGRLKDGDWKAVEEAIYINILLPRVLAAKFSAPTRILSVATDCVFGTRGNYSETSPKDGWDNYAKTKALGEVVAPNYHFVRTSIIGPEWENFYSFLEFVRKQPKGSVVKGFQFHLWNGVTTLTLSKIFRGIIDNDIKLPNIQHLVPYNMMRKNNIVRSIIELWALDLKVEDFITEEVDRTLITDNYDLNHELWVKGGYLSGPRTINYMLEELRDYEKDFFLS